MGPFDNFFRIINCITAITDEARQDFEPILEPVELTKNDYLIRAGERAHYCYMLVEGVIRVFYSSEGNEYNKTFFIPGMFPTPLTALISDSTCEISFQALMHCQLIKFPYQKFKALFDKHRSMERLMLRIMEGVWIKKEKHDIHMVTNDATENYRLFRQNYPGLENQIPQYHIASYLGITPIQLSRIRAQLARSN